MLANVSFKEFLLTRHVGGERSDVISSLLGAVSLQL